MTVRRPAEVGPGQIGVSEEEDRVTYHYYDADAEGAPRLGMRRLVWVESEGAGVWPAAGDALPLS